MRNGSSLRLERVTEAREFDAAEQEALQVVSACGGVLYRRVGATGQAWVAALPESVCGRRAIVAPKACAAQAVQVARDEQITNIMTLADEPARVETLQDGLRLWVVPRMRLVEHVAGRIAGRIQPTLLDLAFGTRS